MNSINKNLAAKACVYRELTKTYLNGYKYAVISQWMFLDYDKEDPITIYNYAKDIVKDLNEKHYSWKIGNHSDGQYIIITIRMNKLEEFKYRFVNRKYFLETYFYRRVVEHVFKENYLKTSYGSSFSIEKDELIDIGLPNLKASSRLYKLIESWLVDALRRYSRYEYGITITEDE